MLSCPQTERHQTETNLNHLGDGGLELRPLLGEEDEVLVERGPLLGLVAHLHDGHQDLGGGVHVATRPRLLLQGQECLYGAHEVAVPCHLFGLRNL